MEAFRLTVIALLSALTWVLGELWMSSTTYSYTKTHLFVVAPIAYLLLVPPRPTAKLDRIPQIVFWTMVFLISIIAPLFCVLSWDRLLWLKGAVYLGEGGNSYGFLFDVPIEEAVWCIDNPLLIAAWILSIWRFKRPVPKKRGSARFGFRVAVVVALLALAYYGYLLLGSEHKYFYLGVDLMCICPLLALQSFLSGHLYVPYAREYVLGAIVPLLYVIGIDYWAMERKIWNVDTKFTIFPPFYGLVFEQVLVYFLTTLLGVHGYIAALRVTEIYMAIRPKVKGSFVEVFVLSLIWGE